MLRGSWRLYVAIGAVFGGCLLGQAQEDAEQPQGASNEQEQETDDSPVPLPVVIVESQESAVSRQRAEQEAKHREERDLLAQEGMDLAARRMANLALWQTVLIAIGTGALIWTLVLTRSANRAAQSAAEAAWEAASTTEEIGLAQSQPYLIIGEEPRLTLSLPHEATAYLILNIPIENVGQTPSSRMNITVDLYAFQGGPRRFTREGCFATHKEENVGSLGKEKIYRLDLSIVTTPSTIKDAQSRTMTGDFDPMRCEIRAEIKIEAWDFAGRQIAPYMAHLESAGAIRFDGGHVQNGKFQHPKLLNRMTTDEPDKDD